MAKLHDALLEHDKKGIFTAEARNLMGYSSGFMPLDYQNGYLLTVTDKNTSVSPTFSDVVIFICNC